MGGGGGPGWRGTGSSRPLAPRPLDSPTREPVGRSWGLSAAEPCRPELPHLRTSFGHTFPVSEAVTLGATGGAHPPSTGPGWGEGGRVPARRGWWGRTGPTVQGLVGVVGPMRRGWGGGSQCAGIGGGRVPVRRGWWAGRVPLRRGWGPKVPLRTGWGGGCVLGEGERSQQASLPTSGLSAQPGHRPSEGPQECPGHSPDPHAPPPPPPVPHCWLLLPWGRGGFCQGPGTRVSRGPDPTRHIKARGQLPAQLSGEGAGRGVGSTCQEDAVIGPAGRRSSVPVQEGGPPAQVGPQQLCSGLHGHQVTLLYPAPDTLTRLFPTRSHTPLLTPR